MLESWTTRASLVTSGPRVIKGVHVVPMGMSNAFLIEGDDGLTLIDAGFPGKEAVVFGAIRGLGRSPDQIKHLIFTHGHPDHIGSAAAIVRETGASTYMHPLDIPMAESGGPFRPMRAAPGLLRQVLCKLFYHPDERLEPVAIDQPLTAGEILPIAGGIEVIHTPGHCAGQVALLWRPGRMLFAGDVGTNLMGLGDPVGFESLKEGRASQRKLASLSFDAAGFGHGKPIARDASTRFRNKWGKKIACLTWETPALGRDQKSARIRRIRSESPPPKLADQRDTFLGVAKRAEPQGRNGLR
jgi:glyoxylase-like metal-dependent hydrolase (beta-lactamase superfamily II)